jgi:hypothetical protein
MTNIELEQKVAQLEFEHDQLISELSHTNQLLKSVGFPDGIKSIKEIAEDLLSSDGEIKPPENMS